MIYPTCLRPLFFCLDPESVHNLVFSMGETLQATALGRGVVSSLYAPQPHPALEQTLFGQTFEHPIGLAAGFDKNIRLPKLLQALGFSHVEFGSLSAQAAPGNPKPRLFRLPQDEAIINRMGLNNLGIPALLPRLEALPTHWPAGLSLVKTHNPDILGQAALDDFAAAIRHICGLGTYVSINISCPNTREGKTFEDPEALNTLLSTLRQAEAASLAENPRKTPRPWCLKISPDMDSGQLKELFGIACRHRIAGWVVANTTAQRPPLKTPAEQVARIGAGGLSGPPLQVVSTRLLGELYQLGAPQQGMILIGVGGIRDVDSAWDKITHGASLIQIYTALIYEGPGLIKRLHGGLLHKLKSQGFSHLEEAIGSAFR